MPEAVDLNKERAIQNIHTDIMYPWEGKAPVVRRVEKADFNRVMCIEEACFPGALGYPRKQMYYLMFRASSLSLVEECEGIVTGYVIALFRKDRKIAGIETIGVDPQYRRTGTGLRLLCAAEAEMVSRGISLSTLEVSVGNHSALNLYNKAGYSPVRIIENFYRFEHEGTRTAYRMAKHLRAQEGLK